MQPFLDEFSQVRLSVHAARRNQSHNLTEGWDIPKELKNFFASLGAAFSLCTLMQFAPETAMLDTYLTPDAWVLLACASFSFGYLLINQVLLRLAMMVGSLCYIAYYFSVGDTPLWEAIYGSMLMIFTNILGLCALWYRNTHIALPRGSSDNYHLFAPMRPGDFRALMRLGHREIATKERTLSREACPIDKLFFVVSGNLEIQKRNSAFLEPGPVFVGEVAYLLGTNSSATTIAPAGTEIMTWDVEKLGHAFARKPQLKIALDAVISNDLATKVYYSVAPADILEAQTKMEPAMSPAPLN